MKKQTYHSNSRYKVCANLISNDLTLYDQSIKVKDNMLEMMDHTGEFIDKYSFSLNKIFEPNDQKQIQDYCIQNVISLVTDKSNGCIISYSLASSQKSIILQQQDQSLFGRVKEKQSLIQQTVQYLLKNKDQKTKIMVGYLDLYIDNIVDLAKAYQQIQNNQKVTINYETSSLNVKVDFQRITVENQTKIEIKTLEDFQQIINICDQFKKSQDNKDLNLYQDCSTIIQFFIQYDESENKSQSVLSMVELASFRQVAKVDMIGKNLIKNIVIKNSLITLRQCLQAVAQSNENMAPFKDSQLSKILKDSIDQDSYIILMNNVHIYQGFNFENQLNALFFSDKTRKLINIQKKKDKANNRSNNQLIVVDDKSNNKLEEEMKILQRNLVQKKFELEQQNKNFRDNYEIIKNVLGLSFDIQNMMSKNLDKGKFNKFQERRQFDLKKEAIIKIEQINLQIDEILNEKDALMQKFQEIKKEEFQKQEKLLQLMIEQKDLNRSLNDQIQQNNLLNEQNLKNLQNNKNQLQTKFEKDNLKLTEEKQLFASKIQKKIFASTSKSTHNKQEPEYADENGKKELKKHINQYQEVIDMQVQKIKQQLQNKIQDIENAQQQSNQYFHKKEIYIQQLNQELLEEYAIVKRQFDTLEKIQQGLYCSKNQTIFIPDIPQKPTRTEYLHLFKVIDEQNSIKICKNNKRKLSNISATFQPEQYLIQDKFKQSDIQSLQEKLKKNLKIEQQLKDDIQEYQQKALKLDVFDLQNDSKRLKSKYERELNIKSEIRQKMTNQKISETYRQQINPMAQSYNSGFPTIRNTFSQSIQKK